MKERVYRLLVTRVPGIRDRFLLYRQQKSPPRTKALLYLLWLNLQYYLLFRRSLGHPLRFPYYEVKTLYSDASESSLSYREPPQALAERLLAYDVISFDVFDTLLFRPFSHPTDLFFLIGMRLGYPDFKQLRISAEIEARKRKQRESGTSEVTLQEIWALLEQETGIPGKTGMRVELVCELRCCFANPYMRKVVQTLLANGKTIVAASDMYLGEQIVRRLLRRCGYRDLSGYFVSCDRGVSKSDGGLYRLIRKTYGEHLSYVHIGDHEHSDQKQALRHHMSAVRYPNVNQAGGRYRPEDMSAITGSLYRGIVNAHIHCGLAVYSREYEYGFVYGGLFVTGYCRFIHEYAAAKKMDKILFLSRDGAVLLQAYRLMYPQQAATAVYAYWSRLAAVKLSARDFKADYFRRFLTHKAGQGHTIRQALASMELINLLQSLCQTAKLRPDEKLTHKNAAEVKRYLMENWDKVLAQYEEQLQAGKRYYGRLLHGCRRAAAVDIGWAGSGAVMLDDVVNRIWGLNCRITGLLAGTNTRHSPDADAAEPFLFNGRLVSYLYSQQENRDLWKFHDASLNHNLYWELLLGAPEGSLKGFYPDPEKGVVCKQKDNPPNAGRISEIHRGILDFVSRFLQVEKRIGVTIPISGRDAYAPMLSVLSGRNKKFTEGLEGLLDEVHIG